MAYCNNCGREISHGTHCSDCKMGQLNQEIEKERKNNKILFGVIIFIGIFILLFLIFKSGNVISEDMEKQCPYECCGENSGYLVKSCPDLYECKESKCKAIDSDNDGLSDIDENKIGTDPYNQNTDRDRYNDNIDPNPLTSNSAKINVLISSKSWNWKYGNIVLAMVGGSVLNPDIVIAEPKVDVVINNDGTDYTNFVDFNILFKISNTLISQKVVHINKFNVDDKFEETYVQQIKAGDVPDLLINLVTQKTNDWGIEIQNLNYEKFL